jgi:hypothetical protein
MVIAVVFDIGGVLETTPDLGVTGLWETRSRIYALICARLDLHAHETVFLDDKDLCVDGARDAGIHAVRYQDNAQAADEIEKLLTGPQMRPPTEAGNAQAPAKPRPSTRRDGPGNRDVHCPRTTRSAADPDGAG